MVATGRDAGILQAVVRNDGFARALHLVRQKVPRLIAGDRRVAAFVEAFVGIGDVTRGTPRAAVVATLFTTVHADVAALALLARIGDAGKVGML